MDLETENRLATLLLEEARRLRVEAEKEGVHAYLREPNVRHRPNSRFLAATVLGVQQANRAVEVNEMWRAREKEMELDAKLKRPKEYSTSRGEKRKAGSSHQSSSSWSEPEERNSAGSSLSKSRHFDSYSDDNSGLKDDEVENFLHSRIKRGRGAVGSRMDEPGPYLAALPDHNDDQPSSDVRVKEEWERRVLGPEKPQFMKSKSPDDSWSTKDMAKEASKSKKHHKKEKKKERSSEKRRKEKKRSKHHHHHKRRRGSRED